MPPETAAIRTTYRAPYAAADGVGAIDIEKRTITGVRVMQTGVARGHGDIIGLRTLETFRDSVGDSLLRLMPDHDCRVTETIGYVRNLRIEPVDTGGHVLLGDAEFLRDAQADRVLELAQKAPRTFALSVSYFAEPETRADAEGMVCLEAIDVAVVDVPAANERRLYAAPPSTNSAPENTTTTMTPEEIQKLIADALAPLTEKMSKLEAAMKPADAPKPDAEVAAMRAQLTELGSKLEKVEHSAIATVAKKLGVAVDQPKWSAPTEQTTSTVKPFAALRTSYEAHIKAGKSQVVALGLAAREQHKEYAAFLKETNGTPAALVGVG